MAKISFQQRGAGRPVILLHGFPMDQSVWDGFAETLSNQYTKIFTPDLPGFGKSELLSPGFSIADVADRLFDWINEQGLSNSVVIGHSLGGYVALALVEKNPQAFAGLGLFHSTAYADNAEKKQSRTKALEFIDKNGVLAFTSNFIQPLFANPAHPAIQTVKRITARASTESVTGYTLAMRDRPDRTHVLSDFKKPVLFIGGEKDGGIPAESIRTQSALCSDAYVHILDDVAHMGMFEKQREAEAIIRAFLAVC